VDRPILFGEELRRLRRQRGLSLRDLAKLTHHSKTVIWEWESGSKIPNAEAAIRVDKLLEADGTLVATVAVLPPVDVNAERLTHTAGAPRSVDSASIDALAGILANMRRLEDSVGAAPLITATFGPLKLVELVAQEARGPLRRRVVDLAGQWAQFAGWLRAATGQPGKAREWYAKMLEHATEAGNRDLIATSLSMRGNLAWMAHQSAPLIGLSAAAVEHAASPGVRAMAEQQEARGYAIEGEAQQVERLLDRAEVHMTTALERVDEQPPWIYFYSPGYLQMQRGLAYRLLGRTNDAIAALTAGLAATDTSVRSSEFGSTYVLYLAEEHLRISNRDVAEQLLEQVRQVAASTGSKRLTVDVDRLVRRFQL
jgi:transcriptional regulator with XRE-family HTH domain